VALLVRIIVVIYLFLLNQRVTPGVFSIHNAFSKVTPNCFLHRICSLSDTREQEDWFGGQGTERCVTN
jgi:hypothetical protein